MRKICTHLVILLSFVSAYSQTELAKNNKQDFATPDHPAFKILDADPSTILRPSNIKEFSSITSEYFKKPAYVIPRTFSMEISPALLARSNKLSVQDYAAHWLAYGLRLSVATRALDDSWAKRDVGIGLRMTIYDEGDFRKDTAFLNPLEVIVHGVAKSRKDAEDGFDMTIANEQEYKDLAATVKNAMGESKTDANMAANDYITRRKLELLNLYISDSTHYAEANAAIDELRKKYKEDHWNATRVDWGIASKFSSPDTVFSKNMRYSKTSLWITGALKIGQKTGKAQHQLLVAANINHEFKPVDSKDTTIAINDSTNQIITQSNDSLKSQRVTYSLSLRYYIGTNRVKGFLEGQLQGVYSSQNKYLDFKQNITQNSSSNALHFLLSAGMEVNITDGVWLLANAGYTLNYNDSGTKDVTSKFVYKLDFRFNLPDKFKLF